MEKAVNERHPSDRKGVGIVRDSHPNSSRPTNHHAYGTGNSERQATKDFPATDSVAGR